MPDKQSLREWMATEILTDATLLSAIRVADSILSHIREEIGKVESGLTDDELFSTPSSQSSPPSIHSLSDYWALRKDRMEVAKAQESKTKQAILKLLDEGK